MQRFLFLLAALALLPLSAQAHAFGQQYTLPLPVNLYLIGGVGAFIVSCALLAFTGPRRSNIARLTVSFGERAWSIITLSLSFVFFSALAASIVIGFLGSQAPYENLLVYLFWIGLVLVIPYISALVSGLWEMGNPFKLIVDVIRPDAGGKEPWRYGYLPALTAYFLLIVLELFFSSVGTTPRFLATLVLAYVVYLTLGSLRYGTRTWLAHADVFTVFFMLAGKLAPIRLGDSRLQVSSPVSGLVDEAPERISLVVFILFALAATAYDGFRESRLMLHIILDVFRTDWTITSFAIFLFFPVAFFMLYTLALAVMKRLASGVLPLAQYLLRFAYSLVPILLAYHFSHYLSLMTNSFGLLIGADIIWYIQLFVIVSGHTFAAYIAHQIALREFQDHRRALISQLPLRILMVFYTAFGLWILSQPFAV